MSDRPPTHSPHPPHPTHPDPMLELLVTVRALASRMESIEEVLVREKVASRLERVEEMVSWIRDRLERGSETLDRVPELDFAVRQLAERAGKLEAGADATAKRNGEQEMRLAALESTAASWKWILRAVATAAVTAAVAALGSVGVWVIKSMSAPGPAAGGTGGAGGGGAKP